MPDAATRTASDGHSSCITCSDNRPWVSFLAFLLRYTIIYVDTGRVLTTCACEPQWSDLIVFFGKFIASSLMDPCATGIGTL